MTMGVDHLRREASIEAAQHSRRARDSGRVTEIFSSEDGDHTHQSPARSQLASPSQRPSGWLARLKSKAVLPASRSSSIYGHESSRDTEIVRWDQRDMPPPAGLDHESMQRSSTYNGRHTIREQSSQPNVSGLADRVPSPLTRIGSLRTDRGGGLDPATLHEIFTRPTETIPADQSSNRIYEWIPRVASVRASSVTGIRSETATRIGEQELPDHNSEGHANHASTRRETTAGQEGLDDRPDPTQDDTDASVIHGINVNDMLAIRPGRRPELLSRGSLRKPDPSFWAERQEREFELLDHMRRNPPPRDSGQGRSASRPRAYRLKWRKREVKRLLRLWFEHGNSWARIKAIDDRSAEPQLQDRTQVDLKDKLRTIKAWMMR